MVRPRAPPDIGVRTDPHGGMPRSSPAWWCEARSGARIGLIARRPLVIVALAAGVTALALACLRQARDHPDLAPGGAGDASLALQLVAALALVAGAVHVARRAEAVLAGALLAGAAGLAFHALPDPPDGAALFTLSLVGASLAPAAVAHAALVYPGGRLAAPLDAVAVAFGYAVHVGLAGLLVAFVLDPARAGCFACPDNLLLVHADQPTADWLAHWAPRAVAATEVALAVLIVVRWIRRAPSIAAPVSGAAIIVLALSAVTNLRAADGLAREPLDRGLWLVTVAALGLVALALMWRPVRAARVRAALGRLTVAVSAGPEDIRATLADACGDRGLSIAVPHPETGEPLALDGTPASPVRARTPVERRGRLVAWLDHDPSVPAIPEIARPAALTLEREALRASARLQEEEIRASTARLVEAGDAERRRLERNLHDGAQQRLLALALALERTHGTDEAQVRIGAMRNDLRRLAHGIHSVTLAEGGLAEAVLALVQAADGRVAVEALPATRASAAAEAAIYRVVAVTLRVAGSARLAIDVRQGDLRAAVGVTGVDEATLNDALAGAGARIAALGGELTVSGGTVRAAVPA
jgi:signal transduction histidine kinase